MNWFRRLSVGVPAQQEAAPTPTPSPPLPPSLPEMRVDDLPEELQYAGSLAWDKASYQSPEDACSQHSDDLSSSELGDDNDLEEPLRLPAMLSDAPARGVKRQAEEDQMDIDEEGPTFEYNSSGVCPEDGARHNQRVTKRPPVEHLLHLPEPIQQRIYSYVLVSDTPYQVAPDGEMLPKPVVYWKIRDDRSLTRKELRKHDGNAICRPPGLLTVCKQIRTLARDVFYVGNDFEVQIGNFDGEAIMEWWKRVSAVRSIYLSRPIMLAGRHPVCQLSQVRRSRYYQKGLSPLHPGKIELKVSYEPNWNNLATWLNLCLMGRLPAYRPSDLYLDPDGYRLQTVAWLFDIIHQYSKGEWRDFDRTIDTHREHLIRDDLRWSQFPDPERGFECTRGSPVEEAGRTATFTSSTVHASAKGSEQGSASSSHTMYVGSPDQEATDASTYASHAHTAGSGWDGFESGGSEDEGGYEEDGEGEDAFDMGEENEADISDSITDEMDVDDGHRHKRRRFPTVDTDSLYG